MHADSCLGLDDLRGIQKFDLSALKRMKDPSIPRDQKPKHPPQVPMPVYLSQPCLEDIAPRFPWLFPYHQPTSDHQNASKPCSSCASEDESESKSAKKDKPEVKRYVASLDVRIFREFEPFEAEGLKVIPLPIMHGEDLVSYGFAFTVGETHVLYLSDISRMLPETMDFIQTKLPQTDILIVDSLHPEGTHPVHFSMEQAIDLARKIRPTRQTYLVGMSCDSYLPHDEMNQVLAEKYGDVQLAHDGLQIDC